MIIIKICLDNKYINKYSNTKGTILSSLSMDNNVKIAKQKKHTSFLMLIGNFMHAADLAANRQLPEKYTPTQSSRTISSLISIL